MAISRAGLQLHLQICTPGTPHPQDITSTPTSNHPKQPPQVAKLRRIPQNCVRYDQELGALVVRLPNTEEDFLLDPATVRRNDQSAASINEWTGERTLRWACGRGCWWACGCVGVAGGVRTHGLQHCTQSCTMLLLLPHLSPRLPACPPWIPSINSPCSPPTARHLAQGQRHR